jgi:hypothetical protein
MSLIYRSRELGLLSDATARRAYQRIKQMDKLGLTVPEPVTNYPGETPCLLSKAFAVAEAQGLTHNILASELKWRISRLQQLLGQTDTRPALRLV